jgi:pyruvate dehydrogenase E1 component alpha subunit
MGADRQQLQAIAAAAGQEVAAAVRAAAAGPWPAASVAYTEIQDTGSGRWT